MDFQNYINHNTHPSTNKPSNTPKNTSSKPRVIKFVGNMQDNIKQLLHGVNCHCGNKKQFYNILLVFANKIEKLRNERDHYKNTLKEYLLTMNSGSATSRNHCTLKPKNLNSEITQKPVTTKLQSVPSSTLPSSNDKQNPNPLTKVAKLFHKEQFKTLYTQQSQTNSNKNHNKAQLKQSEQNTRNNFTAIKKPQNHDTFLLKQIRTEEKRMSHFYKTEKKTFEEPCDDGSFSLNLSSFEDIQQKQKQTSEFMKEVSSIMSETNLLDSDDQNQETDLKKSLNDETPRLTSKVSQLQEKVNKLKMLKQSNNFEEILLSLNDEETKKQTQSCVIQIENKKNMKKKENPEEFFKNQSKSIKKGETHTDKENVKGEGQNDKDKKRERQNDKENMKGESCLKKYNISLEKLEEFIENKECLKQLQKTQQFDMNLKSFKSISSCSLKKDLPREYDSLKQGNRGRALEERKFHFNI